MAENEMNRNENGSNMSGSGDDSGNSMASRDNGLTTPVSPEDGWPVDSGDGMEHTPVPPAAPEGGWPVDPGPVEEHIPAPPVAPEGGWPADPGPMEQHIPTPPMAPEGGPPVVMGPGPVIPNAPVIPGPFYPPTQYFGQVRFLNASANSFPVNISIDNTTYAINSRFGTISNYDWIGDGFHTITVRRATGLRSILLQQTFPFSAGMKATMVLTDTSSGGLNMVKVADTGCNNIPYNAGCYRFANMAYAGSNFDLMLYGGETVFRNVSFQEVTAYKQAMTGSYQFYVTNSSNFSIIREIPMIVIGAFTSGGMNNEPLLSFQVDIVARRNYTTYLIGNTWSDSNLQALTVED